LNWFDTHICGEHLRLSPDRALYWPRHERLLLADPHFGKGGVFRQNGLAVPSGDTGADLDRVSHLLEETGARELFVLGDFLHAPPRGSEPWLERFSQWRRRHAALRVVVTRGNHDRLSRAPAQWDIEWQPGPIVCPPFVLQHEPAPSDAGYVLAGHLHPVVRLGSARESLRTPVFWFGDAVGVLPAFGSFTGGSKIRPQPGDRLFAVGPDIVELTLAGA
jgi:DNA ligase-associated metallophosphoesterase